MSQRWSGAKVELLSQERQNSVTLDANRAVYKVTDGQKTESIPVTVFVSPQSKAAWVGPEQDRYLETDEGIVGFRLVGRHISWYDSLLEGKDSERPSPARQPGPTSVEQLVKNLENNVTGSRLRDAKRSADADQMKQFIKAVEEKAAGAQRKVADRPVDVGQARPMSTSLEAIRNPWMFTNGTLSSQLGAPKIVHAQMDGEELKLDLTDQTEKYHATIWIDVESRKATKAEEGPWTFFGEPDEKE